MDSKTLERALLGALTEADCGRILGASEQAKSPEEFRTVVERRLPKLKGSPIIEVAAREIFGKPRKPKAAKPDPKESGEDK